MKFNLSINISQGVSDNFNYIVTPNAQKVYGNIVDSFQSGIHSFLIIGTYGTGKSSFLMALEQDLLNNKSKLVSERSVFADAKSFEFMNIVGDYSSLSTLLSKDCCLSISPFAIRSSNTTLSRRYCSFFISYRCLTIFSVSLK